MKFDNLSTAAIAFVGVIFKREGTMDTSTLGAEYICLIKRFVW